MIDRLEAFFGLGITGAWIGGLSRSFRSEFGVRVSLLNKLSDTLRQVSDMQGEGIDLMALPELAEDNTLKNLEAGRIELLPYILLNLSQMLLQCAHR